MKCFKYFLGRRNIFEITVVILLIASFLLGGSAAAFASPSGNLNCQIPVGNIVFTVLNPHTGFAGPKFGDVSHVNIRVDYAPPLGTPGSGNLANFHIVKYTTTGSNVCLYVWESVTNTTIADTCFPDFSTGINNVMSTIKQILSAKSGVNLSPASYALVCVVLLICCIAVAA